MGKNLIFLAGKNAYQAIKDNGLTPDSVKIIAGAAGGPKWLVLNRFDRMLFIEFFKHRQSPLYLIGSSIGAWRFAAMCQQDPISAQQRFEEAYINQRYEKKPSPADISAESWKILDFFLADAQIKEILSHPYLRIGFLSARCKWPSSKETRVLLGSGLLIAFVANALNRTWLKWQFERALFHHPESHPPYLTNSSIPIHRIKLSSQNFKQALLSSGSIPLVMEGVNTIAGAPAGIYRDGGLIDYHLDIPFQTQPGEIVLFPHFTQRIIPGWLDKAWKWRKPNPDHCSNVLLIAPSPNYISKLPNHKIPDRNDFYRYQGKDDERIADWSTVVKKGQLLADEFAETIASGKIRQVIQPLT